MADKLFLRRLNEKSLTKHTISFYGGKFKLENLLKILKTQINFRWIFNMIFVAKNVHFRSIIIYLKNVFYSIVYLDDEIISCSLIHPCWIFN